MPIMKFEKRHIFLIILGAAVSVSSLDTSLKGDGCSSFDSCAVKDLFRTCSCDYECDEYETCCSDAEKFPLMSMSKKLYRCYSDRTTTPVFAKGSCSDDFEGNSDYIGACTGTEEDKADMANILLVSSSSTRITYRNINCGICNNEEIGDLVYWTVEVSCPSKRGNSTFKESYIRKNLYYNEGVSEWGIDAGEDFVQCVIRFHQPDYMVGKLKYCAPNAVSSCPEDYVDENVITKCSYYHGERKHKTKAIYYKNVHCALCNNVTLKELDCVGRTYGHVNLVSGFNIMKIIFTSGTWLEREDKHKYKCSSNFLYDPFQKRCRRVIESSNLAAGSAVNVAAQIYVTIFALMFVRINKYV